MPKHWFIDDLYQLSRDPLFKLSVFIMLAFCMISLTVAIALQNHTDELAQCRRAERRAAEAEMFFRNYKPGGKIPLI